MAGVALGVETAFAATTNYVSNEYRNERQSSDSGVRARISGGVASTEPFSADGANVVLTIETYYPAPGYRTVGYASSGGSVNLTHAAVANARSKCMWDWPWSSGSIGALRTTCGFYQ